jgi:hypothetical protein
MDKGIEEKIRKIVLENRGQEQWEEDMESAVQALTKLVGESRKEAVKGFFEGLIDQLKTGTIVDQENFDTGETESEEDTTLVSAVLHTTAVQIIQMYYEDWLVDGKTTEQEEITGETSDGYHTFNELYEFRKLFNAALFNEWAKQSKFNTYKSKRHFDGEECFGGGWFIVGAELPTGCITNHYELKDWDLFQIPEASEALPWDGHTPQDVAKRLGLFLSTLYPEQEGRGK